ncbi:hypothetical protein [Rufibacter soli]
MKYFSEKETNTNPMLVELRGVIISKAISIEGFMDKIILYFFAGGDRVKYQVLYDALIKDLTVSKKQEVLKKVLRQLPLTDKENVVQKVANSLGHVFRVRNTMAHAQWTMIDPDGVTFKKNQNAEGEVMGEAEVAKFNEEFFRALGHLTEVYYTHIYDIRTRKPFASIGTWS